MNAARTLLAVFLFLVLIITGIATPIFYVVSEVNSDYEDRAELTTAKIEGIQKEIGRDRYHLEISFTTNDGQLVKTKIRDGRSTLFKSGDNAKIYYDPHSPENADLERRFKSNALARKWSVSSSIIFTLSLLLMIGLSLGYKRKELQKY